MENKASKSNVSFENLRTLSQINNKELIKMDKEVKELLEKLEKVSKELREQLKKNASQKDALVSSAPTKVEKKEALKQEKEVKVEQKEVKVQAAIKPVQQKSWQKPVDGKRPFSGEKAPFNKPVNGFSRDKKPGFAGKDQTKKPLP